jgi:hypothetical protein
MIICYFSHFEKLSSETSERRALPHVLFPFSTHFAALLISTDEQQRSGV